MIPYHDTISHGQTGPLVPFCFPKTTSCCNFVMLSILFENSFINEKYLAFMLSYFCLMPRMLKTHSSLMLVPNV
uniref:Putative ovule protein n=1 Tax=Solanum chacoense TaxID=4108 RepID=A0A0V0H6X8_SOLCH